MSDAFKQQWMRTSAAKRLLTMLTAIAKSKHHNTAEPLTFTIDELEAVTPGDGLVQSIEGGKLILRYVPDGTQMFVMDGNQATERGPIKWPASNEEIPERLEEALGLRGTRAVSPTVTTTDDAEMAAREAQGNTRSRVQREAAIRRSQPLPLTQPQHQPS